MTETQTTYHTPVTDTLRNHVSVRSYSGESVPDGMLHEILNAARRSPTSSNIQAYTLIVVRNPDTKKQLAVLAGDQEHIETCDVFVAICADIYRLAHAVRVHGMELARNLETTLVSSIDAALVGMSMATAAESFGLGHVMIGGMRNHPREVGNLLGLPEGVYVVFGMCLGWPDEIPPQKPRLPEDLIIHYEQYDASDPTEKLKAHDSELAKHYRSLGRNLHDAAWTGVMTRKFGTPRRPHLREALEAMGFRFD
ncbi:MAG: NADPH-dependent oxidoreductase [Chloroflexi bacterium]|nr:NADPH-dependent oxidoreductase [Chloroflexota bacterium]